MRHLTFIFGLLLVIFLSNGIAGPRKKGMATRPETVIKAYVNWYKHNRERLEKFNMVPGSPGDSTHAYAVDFTVAEAYLRDIKKSGFVSDQYIDNFREYFKANDDYMKKNPQFDGPAYGFGIDLVYKGHDTPEIEYHLKKFKILSKSISGNKAQIVVKMASSKYIFNLSKSGKSWLIDSLTY